MVNEGQIIARVSVPDEFPVIIRWTPNFTRSRSMTSLLSSNTLNLSQHMLWNAKQQQQTPAPVEMPEEVSIVFFPSVYCVETCCADNCL